jgi:hypothetical protein
VLGVAVTAALPDTGGLNPYSRLVDSSGKLVVENTGANVTPGDEGADGVIDAALERAGVALVQLAALGLDHRDDGGHDREDEEVDLGGQVRRRRWFFRHDRNVQSPRRSLRRDALLPGVCYFPDCQVTGEAVTVTQPVGRASCAVRSESGGYPLDESTVTPMFI